jgi:succinoglycan biosynthesis transport protein ExoP
VTAAPLVERSRRSAARVRPPRARRAPSRSLAQSRLRRSLTRQWWIALLVAFAVVAAGVIYDALGGVRPLTSALFWLPFGLIAGLTLALVREIGRNTITSVSSLGKHRNYAVLGAAPELTPKALRQLPPDRRTPIGCLAFQQASPFSTAFRDLQHALNDSAVVSFIAPLPGEGATTSAVCAAVSATQQGRKTIIVDCDTRPRTLSHYLGNVAEVGTLEASQRPNGWQSFVHEEEETGLHYIPAARGPNPWRTLADTATFPDLIEQLRNAYDLVILDCPPALGSADGPVVAGMADQCVVVAAWDRTPVSALRNTMRVLHRGGASTGVYVNRVPPEYRFGRLRGD